MTTKWAAVLGLWLMVCAAGAWAGDVPPTEQVPGAHSSVSLRDGSIRDDELARLICEYIPTVAGVRQVSQYQGGGNA